MSGRNNKPLVREEIEAQHQEAMADLEAAAAEWLETRAAGKDTHRIEAAMNEAERTTRRLERKLHRIDKRDRRRSTT